MPPGIGYGPKGYVEALLARMRPPVMQTGMPAAPMPMMAPQAGPAPLIPMPQGPGLLGGPGFANMAPPPNANLQLQPQMPMPQPPAMNRALGAAGRALERFFGGHPDPNLSDEENEQAARDAMVVAGLTMLSNSGPALVQPGFGQVLAQGALAGQQAGAQSRDVIYAQTAAERLQQALQDPAIVGKLTPEQVALVRLLPPDQAAALLTKLAFAPAPEPVALAEGSVLVDPSTGEEVFRNTKGVEVPSELRGLATLMGVDLNNMTQEQADTLSKRWDEFKRAGATTVSVGESRFSDVNALASQFRQDIGEAQSVASGYGRVLASAQNPSAAGDISMIFAYMKMLDPQSVVREGEQATARNAASVPDRIRNLYNRLITTGESLTDKQRADYVDRAHRLAEQKQAQIQPVIKRYERRANAAELDPTLVIFDPFAEVGLTDPFADLVPEG